MDKKEGLKKLGTYVLILVVVIALIMGISAAFSVGTNGEPFFKVVGFVLIAILAAGAIFIIRKIPGVVDKKKDE